MELSVSRSQTDGRDVLCVSDARTEQEAGRYDRRSGRLVVIDQARVYEVVQALWDFLADTGGGAAGPACPPCADEPHSAARAMPEVSVSDVAGVRGALTAPDVPDTGDALEAAEAAEAAEPGDAFAATTGASGAKGKGGRLVDRRLGRLRRDGWAVLSPGGRGVAGFDRLVIGPPGVFAITVAHGDEAPGRGHGNAESAARMLSAASGMVIKVIPMLAFVGGDADTVQAYLQPGLDGGAGGVLVARGEDIAEVLWGLPAVYSIQERKQISEVARQTELWRAA